MDYISSPLRIYQSKYLFVCTAAKTSTFISGLVNRKKLSEIIDLKEIEKVVFTHVVSKSY